MVIFCFGSLNDVNDIKQAKACDEQKNLTVISILVVD